MFRIKAWLTLLACLFALPANAESLIPDSMIQDEAVHYDTVAVELGDYERTVSSGAAEFYPATRAVRCAQDGARFLEYRVDRGDMVKKGDILAVFTLEFDEAALQERQLQLARARESLEREILAAEEELEEMEMALLGAGSAQDQAMARLRIQRAEIALAQMTDSRLRQIAAMEKEIEELEFQRADNALIAPMDGQVSNLEYKREGDRVAKGETLITLQRTDMVLLALDNADGAFRYGMEVAVQIGNKNNYRETTGRVVCADALIPMNERLGYACVAFDQVEGEKLNRATVQAVRIRVENVMLIPRKAVALDGGRNYVMQLIDGVAQKRFINCVVESGAKTVWVLQGLEPGDQIILD